LFARWRPLLRLQARRLLGAELAARADPSDIVQETSLQAFRDLDQFRGRTEAEWVAWLRCLVAGHAAKARRHHFAEQRDPGREHPLPGPDVADQQAGPVFAIIDEEQAVRLAAAIEELSEAMREVVVRRVFHEEPFEVVAAALDRSPGATRVLWTRALKRLREMLPKEL
jgi:RNA polymerase sigma-70 factor (ECF subfamily)